MSTLTVDVGTYRREARDVIRELVKFSREPIEYPVDIGDEIVVTVDSLRSVAGIVAERAGTTPEIVNEILERLGRGAGAL